MIKGFVKYLFALVGLEVRKSESWGFNRLGSFGIQQDEWEIRDKKYYLKLFKLAVNDISSPLISGYRTAKQITEQGGGRFSYDSEGHLMLSIKGVNFFINFGDELYVIREVFVSGDYNFKTTDEIVVLDIGLNIGATSLFFAQQKNVRKVYAYELFQPTFQEAVKNLELNNSKKIVALNVGLGKETKQFQISYSPTNKARMGFHGLPPGEEFSDAVDVTVSVKDAAEELRRIHALEPNAKWVCKMDCEGAEYEILEQIFAKNVAGLIDTYIIEWHSYDTQSIEKEFLKSGFDVVKSSSGNALTGLIYAFKKAK